MCHIFSHLRVFARSLTGFSPTSDFVLSLEQCAERASRAAGDGCSVPHESRLMGRGPLLRAELS